TVVELVKLYENDRRNIILSSTPAYDYAPNPDKQWILQVTKQMQPIHRQFTDLLMTKRLQTLQSVDEAVDRVRIDEIVLNLDLAPTFLDIAGVDTPSHMDGRSFLPLLHRIPKHGQIMARRKKFRWPDTFLIESSGRREIPEAFLEDKDNARRHHHQGIYNTDSNSESLASESSATNTTAGSVSATFTTHDPNQLIEDIDSNNDTDILILTADDDDSSLDKIPVLSRKYR
ncbi:unnamed protein product, partial [Timema podura]|nr:unnamed protein product [Timema podura]